MLRYHYSQEFPDEDKIVIKVPHAPLESNEMFYLSVPIEGNQEKFAEWLSSEEDRDFANQTFSAERIDEWLRYLNLKSVYSFKVVNHFREEQDENSKMDESTLRDQPLATKERNTLLTIIAALAKEAKVNIDPPGKAAGFIEGLTDLLGAPVSKRAIEEHLKKIPNALESRMK
jgi:hypothetical protein